MRGLKRVIIPRSASLFFEMFRIARLVLNLRASAIILAHSASRLFISRFRVRKGGSNFIISAISLASSGPSMLSGKDRCRILRSSTDLIAQRM